MLLFDSYGDYEQDDASADAHRKQIPAASPEKAVADCLDAAKHELGGFALQLKLLRAAKYGKLFPARRELFVVDAFVETCRSLRLLAVLRRPKVDMLLSYTKLVILTPCVVMQWSLLTLVTLCAAAQST